MPDTPMCRGAMRWIPLVMLVALLGGCGRVPLVPVL